MPIYTKFGDHGSTNLLGGAVVPKDDQRVEAYGNVDELNSVIGVIISFNDDLDEVNESLRKIQEDLFVIGAELASKGAEAKSKQINPKRTKDLEGEIDRLTFQLPPLTNFILPGGSKTAALLHHARTVCRRAERSIVALSHKEKINENIIVYMNRVGDLLFMHARYVNHKKKKEEIVWKL